MFDRFAGGARDVVVQARGHARRLGHCWVGTEHLLLALSVSPSVGETLRSCGLTVTSIEREVHRLLGWSQDRDRTALASLGIDLDQIRRAIEANFGRGALERTTPPLPRKRTRRSAATQPNDLPFTPAAKKSLELAFREALRLRQATVEPEHIALGLLRAGVGFGYTIATAAGSAAALSAAIEVSLRKSA